MLEVIRLAVKGQELTMKECPPRLASDTVSMIYAHFEVDENWNYPAIKAIFENSERGVKKTAYLDDEGKCKIPWEVLVDRTDDVKVNLVAGYIEDEVLQERITSFKTTCLIIAQEVNVEATNSLPPTPEEWEQIVDIVERELHKVVDMTVEAEQLTPEQEAYAVKSMLDGVVHLKFGIPQGVKGDKGDPGVQETYVHEQPTASDTWNIEHNLGRFPAVTIVDSANTQVGGLVEYVDQNKLIVSFNGAFSGKAYLN